MRRFQVKPRSVLTNDFDFLNERWSYLTRPGSFSGARTRSRRAVGTAPGKPQYLVAEAFARACASWRKVARHPPQYLLALGKRWIHSYPWVHSYDSGSVTVTSAARPTSPSRSAPPASPAPPHSRSPPDRGPGPESRPRRPPSAGEYRPLGNATSPMLAKYTSGHLSILYAFLG